MENHTCSKELLCQLSKRRIKQKVSNHNPAVQEPIIAWHRNYRPAAPFVNEATPPRQKKARPSRPAKPPLEGRSIRLTDRIKCGRLR